MSGEDPRVRVVLDLSALLRYARLSGLAVGELIACVQEEDGPMVGVPAAHYMSADAQLGDDDRAQLRGLVNRKDSVVVVLPLMGGDVVEACGIGHEMGHAVIEAMRRRAYLATYDGDQARRHLPKRRVLDLDDL